MKTTKKPTLLSLRQLTTITTQEVAEMAGVSLTQAYVVEIGGFTESEIAEKVISAFSTLSGTRYTLEDICLQNVSMPVTKRQSMSTPITQQGELSEQETTKHPRVQRKR